MALITLMDDLVLIPNGIYFLFINHEIAEVGLME